MALQQQSGMRLAGQQSFQENDPAVGFVRLRVPHPNTLLYCC